MKDFAKILVPVDGSKKSFEALDRALTLAGFTHGEVTCIHVIPEVPEGGPRTKEMEKQQKKYSKKMIGRVFSWIEFSFFNW